jgi:hypothetical protein
VTEPEAKKRKYPKLYQCRTVGELVEELRKLPADMSVMGMDDGVALVPVNIGRDDEHLDIASVYDTAWEAGKDWLER